MSGTAWVLTIFLGFGYVTVPDIKSHAECYRLYEKMKPGLFVQIMAREKGDAPSYECNRYRKAR